jgi:hypothetical protein
MLALKREAIGADGRMTKRFAIMVDRLVELACDGDLGAIREVFDRVNGRAPVQLVQPSESQRIVISWLNEGDEPEQLPPLLPLLS